MAARKLPNPEIVDEMLRHQLDLLRLEAGARRRVVGLIDGLQKNLVNKLGENDLTKFNKARTTELLSNANMTVAKYYSRANTEMDDMLAGVSEIQAKHVGKTLENVLVVDLSAGLPTTQFMERLASNAIIMGAPSKDWWARQAQDTAFRFANAVRQGIVAGDTNEVIVARVAGRKGYPGVMDVSRTNARALVHTSIQEVANEARMETFRKNDDIIEGVQQLSTLDSHTTDICMAYANMQWTLDERPIGNALPFDGGPPRHWGCRSILVPITKTFKELGVNIAEPGPGKRASSDGLVKGNITFDEFLSRQTVEQQDEQLGVGRAQLWRDGVITLPQLLDQRGNPLTLEKLREKYA